MEIKERKGYLLVKAGEVKLGIAFGKGANLKLSDELDVGVNMSKGASFNVSSAGEYEVKEVFCMCLENGGGNEYLAEIDGVSILLVGPESKISNKNLEKLGRVDIVVLLGEDIEVSSETIKLINRTDPKIFLLTENIKTETAQIEKLIGIPLTTEEKKIKMKSDELEGEDHKLRMVKITE